VFKQPAGSCQDRCAETSKAGRAENGLTALIIALTLLRTLLHAAEAESRLDRFCRNYAGIPNCTQIAKECGKPTEYAMVADRTC
jgi:hypothetical protein